MEFNKEITYFAQTDFRGKKTTFGIKNLDRARHVYVIGKTGMGKSTMLENMAIQDICNGNGMAFLDPHGGSAEALLDFVPEDRIKDVVYFAPFDLDHPISFNIMEDVGKDQRHLVADGLMSVFKKIWEDAWSARMEYILSNTILALLEYPNATLLGVNRMLSDKNYRQKVVANVTDPSVKSFWVDEFAKYTERFAAEATPAIQNKIGQFTSNPLIRNIIGQPKSSFDLRQIMDEKKILIVNLSKGRVGEQNAKLLGGMLMTKIYLAAMSRANISESELRAAAPFFLYVDEFQSLVNESFSDILSEARKYKLNLTIAHQYIDQMPETVRSAVFGNVGTTITFRVGPFDAEVLETVFSPKFLQEDLVNLGFAQIYLTLMIDGVGSAPFSAVTIAPIPALEESNKEAIIEASRAQFSHGREQVEKVINDWHHGDGGVIPVDPTFAERAKEVFSKVHLVEPVVSKTVEPRPAEKKPIEHKPSEQKMSLNILKPKPKDNEFSQKRKELLDLVKNSDQGLAEDVRPPVKKFSLSALNNNGNKKNTADKDGLRSALKDIIEEKNRQNPTLPTKTEEISINKTETKKTEEKPPAIPPIESNAKKEIPEDELRKMLDVKMDES